MADAEDKTAEQLATEINGPQNEQVDLTAEGSESSAGAQATNDELILGKFKSQADLESAYQELEHKLRTTRPVEPRNPVQQPTVPSQESFFDNETLNGIKSVFKAELEQERAVEFARTHAEELKDPLLRGAVLVEIQEANARGEYLAQEVALANAKKALDARLAPKVDEAKKESFDEGKQMARRKEQAGAVGGVTGKATEVDPETLTAEEYAAYHGLERSF